MVMTMLIKMLLRMNAADDDDDNGGCGDGVSAAGLVSVIASTRIKAFSGVAHTHRGPNFHIRTRHRRARREPPELLWASRTGRSKRN